MKILRSFCVMKLNKSGERKMWRFVGWGFFFPSDLIGIVLIIPLSLAAKVQPHLGADHMCRNSLSVFWRQGEELLGSKQGTEAGDTLMCTSCFCGHQLSPHSRQNCLQKRASKRLSVVWHGWGSWGLFLSTGLCSAAPHWAQTLLCWDAHWVLALLECHLWQGMDCVLQKGTVLGWYIHRAGEKGDAAEYLYSTVPHIPTSRWFVYPNQISNKQN